MKKLTDAELAVTALALRAYEDVVKSHKPNMGTAAEWVAYFDGWLEPWRGAREKVRQEYARRDMARERP